MKNLPKNGRQLWIMVVLFVASTTGLLAQSGQDYTIQSNDWLSKIAQKFYNDAGQYQRIIDATNQKAANDPSYKSIKSPNDISVGQRIWIPSSTPRPAPSTTTTSTTTTTTSPKKEPDANLLTLPKTNCEIRIWYNYQVVAISKLNEKWKADGMSLKARAEKAFGTRHAARVNARFMMQNQDEVKGLQARDMKKYGNPDGPTFEYLVGKSTKKGLSKEEAYEGIIKSSSRTSPVYNDKCK